MAETHPPFVDSKTVTTAGTPEALTTREVRCDSVNIKANGSNTGNVLVCDSEDTAKTYPLDAGESITIPTSDPRTIFIDVSVSGESCFWIAV